LHIVACVLLAKPAAGWLEAFLAQVRRERAAVMGRTAQGATFVRFAAPDLRLVALACQAVQGRRPAGLRFGFAAAVRDGPGGEPSGLDVGTEVVTQAKELAAAASSGEVLVSAALALRLIEAGHALHSRTLTWPGGRAVAAFVMNRPAGAARPDAAAEEHSPAAQAGPEAEAGHAHEASPAAASDPASAAPSAVQRSLAVRADALALRQAELEARQDAVLAKMTLVEEGQPSTAHLQQLQAQLDEQIERVQSRLDVVAQLEQRLGPLHIAVAAMDRRLAQQAQRLTEMEGLRALCDKLLADMVLAHAQLAAVAALQEELLPLTAQVARIERTVLNTEAQLNESQAALHQRSTASAALLAQVESGLQNQLHTVTEHAARVDEVQARTCSVAHQLDDIHLRLEMLSEQRAAIDGVGEQLARLDFTVREAQNTLRALRAEREVAERVEQGIKSLRARGTSRQPT
jgi:hypothetical protein